MENESCNDIISRSDLDNHTSMAFIRKFATIMSSADRTAEESPLTQDYESLLNFTIADAIIQFVWLHSGKFIY